MGFYKSLSILFPSIVLVFVFYTYYYYIKDDLMSKHPFFNIRKGDEVLVIAHRGGLALSPENTIEAFKKADDMGVDAIELDIHSSKDGEIVIMHDDTIDRSTDGSGNITDFTLSELKSFDAGYRWTADEGKSYPFRGKGIKIPTLSEAFSQIKRANIIVEIKQSKPSIIKPLCELIRKYGLESKVIAASFSNEALQEFRRSFPEVATSATKSEVVKFFILNIFHLAGFYSPPAVALQVPEYHEGRRVINKRFVDSARKNNIEVHAWTINELDDMKRMISLGVDAIVTDYPDRLLKLLGRNNRRL